jgi:hypothetical protein
MSAAADPMASPEWESARADWYAMAAAEIARVSGDALSSSPDKLARESVYAPVHDIAGLAGVFGYTLIGKIARGLMEVFRHGQDPLDEKTLRLARAYMMALSALHAKDMRGEGGAAGEAILAKLASIQP